MQRIILIIFIFIYAISAHAQDSLFNRKFCDHLLKLESRGLNPMDDILKFINEYQVDTVNLNKLAQSKNGAYIQYTISKALRKSCPDFIGRDINLLPREVLDLNNFFRKEQRDSLTSLIRKVNEKEEVYLYIVSVDDFEPESNITDFSNRFRERWSPIIYPKKGKVIIVFSKVKRQIRISTGDISMKFLTDKECDEIVQKMLTYFKSEKYTEGLLTGIQAIQEKL